MVKACTLQLRTWKYSYLLVRVYIYKVIFFVEKPGGSIRKRAKKGKKKYKEKKETRNPWYTDYTVYLYTVQVQVQVGTGTRKDTVQSLFFFFFFLLFFSSSLLVTSPTGSHRPPTLSSHSKLAPKSRRPSLPGFLLAKLQKEKRREERRRNVRRGIFGFPFRLPLRLCVFGFWEFSVSHFQFHKQKRGREREGERRGVRWRGKNVRKGTVE